MNVRLHYPTDIQLQLVHYFIRHLPAAQYYLFIYSKDVYIQVLVHVHVYAYHYQ